MLTRLTLSQLCKGSGIGLTRLQAACRGLQAASAYAGRMEHPTTEELLASARVVSLPMRVRFRSVTHREVLLLRGPAGWGEFAP